MTAIAHSGLSQVTTAIEKTISLQAKHPLGQKLLQGMERVTGKIRDTLR